MVDLDANQTHSPHTRFLDTRRTRLTIPSKGSIPRYPIRASRVGSPLWFLPSLLVVIASITYT